MKAFKDGDHWCIVEDDFINLQESPCDFVPVDSAMGRFIEYLEAWKRGEVVYIPFVQIHPCITPESVTTIATSGGDAGWLILTNG